MGVLRIAEQYAVHQRAVMHSGAGMHDNPRRLVYDDDVLVLVDSLEGNVLRLRQVVISELRRQADLNAALDEGSRNGADPSVKGYAPLLYPFLDLAARVVRVQGRENLIEPSSVLLIAGGPHQLLVFIIIEFLCHQRLLLADLNDSPHAVSHSNRFAAISSSAAGAQRPYAGTGPFIV